VPTRKRVVCDDCDGGGSGGVWAATVEGSSTSRHATRVKATTNCSVDDDTTRDGVRRGRFRGT